MIACAAIGARPAAAPQRQPAPQRRERRAATLAPRQDQRVYLSPHRFDLLTLQLRTCRLSSSKSASGRPAVSGKNSSVATIPMTREDQRIMQAGVDVPRRRDDRERRHGQQPADPAGADVVRNGKRRVADPGGNSSTSAAACGPYSAVEASRSSNQDADDRPLRYLRWRSGARIAGRRQRGQHSIRNAQPLACGPLRRQPATETARHDLRRHRPGRRTRPAPSTLRYGIPASERIRRAISQELSNVAASQRIELQVTIRRVGDHGHGRALRRRLERWIGVRGQRVEARNIRALPIRSSRTASRACGRCDPTASRRTRSRPPRSARSPSPEY